MTRQQGGRWHSLAATRVRINRRRAHGVPTGTIRRVGEELRNVRGVAHGVGVRQVADGGAGVVASAPN